MAVTSGLGGAVNGQSTVRNWSASYTSDNKDYGASNTQGGTGRKAGNKDWTGNFGQYGYAPSLFPGESFTFNGYGPEGISGTALVESIEVSCDIEGGNLIESTVNFGGNGAYTLHSTPVTDSTEPDPPSSIGCKVSIDSDNDDEFEDVTDVRTWSLNISCDLKAYNSSDTDGQTARVAGRIDASGSYTVYTDDLSDHPGEGDTFPIRMYVTSSLYWEVAYAVIDSVEPEVDVESGDIVGATINWSWSGFLDGTAGNITKPGAGSASWPAA